MSGRPPSQRPPPSGARSEQRPEGASFTTVELKASFLGTVGDERRDPEVLVGGPEPVTLDEVQRDLQELSRIEALPDFRRLMRAASLRLGQLLNQTELGRDVSLPQPTVHRYLNLLETSYLLLRLPAYAVNRTKRLIKSPKLYWADSGVALHLAQSAEPGGAHLENLVLHDLLVWRDARSQPAEVYYWRTATGEEVDLVVECGDRLLPIEVKAGGRPRLADARHLRSFRSEYGDRALPGLLLHTGRSLEWLAPDVLAVPWWRVV